MYSVLEYSSVSNTKTQVQGQRLVTFRFCDSQENPGREKSEPSNDIFEFWLAAFMMNDSSHPGLLLGRHARQERLRRVS
jgi:hypothetical protein